MSERKLNRLDEIHNFRRVAHFGSKVEKVMLQHELKKDADVQLQIKAS